MSGPGLPRGPDKCIHSRHLCQLSAASAQCLPLAVPMWPVSSPTAAAGGGGWHHRQTRHPARAGGVQAPSPHPALSTRNVSSASSCHIHPTCQLSSPLSALHLHLSSTELQASLLGRSDHPQLPLWSCLLVVHIPPFTCHLSWLSIRPQLMWHGRLHLNPSFPSQNIP